MKPFGFSAYRRLPSLKARFFNRFRRFAIAVLQQSTDAPISIDRAGVFHAILEQAYASDAITKIEPLLSVLNATD